MTDDRSSSPDTPSQVDALWTDLRRLTAARIGLQRAGASLATGPLLDFRLAHARARDAVHEPLDDQRLAADLASLGLPVIDIASAASDRTSYLMRPDLGRQLARGAETTLKAHAGHYDIVFVITDGLSARAVQSHAAPVLVHLLPALQKRNWTIAPLVVVRNGRVAVGDVVANVLNADCVAILIGERPGLSAPDSMGAYLTWQPNSHSTDADRNCISNIRPDGINYAAAGKKILHLLLAIRAQRLSGVKIKDDSDRLLSDQS